MNFGNCLLSVNMDHALIDSLVAEFSVNMIIVNITNCCQRYRVFFLVISIHQIVSYSVGGLGNLWRAVQRPSNCPPSSECDVNLTLMLVESLLTVIASVSCSSTQ